MIPIEEYETLESLLENTDLGFIDKLDADAFHRDGPGRPPRKPLGVFKAHLAKRFLGVRSIRELERRLWSDPRLRRICDLEADEPAYGRTVLSRFPMRVGIERLQRIIDHLLRGLKKAKLVKGKHVAMDASFIKAYSRIDMKTRLGYSDPEARIGRSGRGYGLGYNLHLSVDADSELPVAFTVPPANIRDIQEASNLLKATRRKLPRSIKHLIADRGYSSDPFRTEVRKRRIEPHHTIPCQSAYRRERPPTHRQAIQTSRSNKVETPIQEAKRHRTRLQPPKRTAKPKER